jgi:high-affinity iron transporter
VKSFVPITLALALLTPTLVVGQVQVVDDVHQLQDKLDSSLLDVFEGTQTCQTAQDINRAWQVVNGDLTSSEARAMVPSDWSASSAQALAANIGASRARIQQLAALEMLENQRAGKVVPTQAWRDLITLPKFANADEGGLLLQQAPDQVRAPGVTQSLAKEYIGWQVTRTRQLFDELQRLMASGEATAPYVTAKLAEIQALALFPAPLLQAAGVTPSAKDIPVPSLAEPFDAARAIPVISAWRESIESKLPNLLSPTDVTRLQRLLARFVDVIPKEYHNGVQNNAVVIPLEYKEAAQFTQQAQSLVNELAPVWRRDQNAAFTQYKPALVEKLDLLQKQIAQVKDQPAIEATSGEISSILQNKFGLSAHRAGQGGQIIEETALDVRDSLNNSLAAAKAGHWVEAEQDRLDAYTSFDSEIEVRVMPRNPTLATHTERSFLDGTSTEPGIKALLDRGAPMDDLTKGYETTLKNLDECVALLKVAVSPATIGFTAFTILAREGLEAIVILAALLAGLRGAENRLIRRGIVNGALLGVAASGLTFWLSQTLIHSLLRFGEKLEAVISVFAVIILFIVTNWVFHKMYWVGWNAKLRDLSKSAKAVRAPFWETTALLGVGFLTVYREGFETTIFMQSLLLEGSTTSVALGVLAAFVFLGTIGTLILFFGAKLPYRKLLVVTGVLVVSIMVTFVGSGVRLFQTVGWLPVHPLPGIDLPNWVGVWLGIYPSWEGVLIPPLALVYVGGAWFYTKLAAARAQARMPVGPPIPAARTNANDLHKHLASHLQNR